MKRIGPDNLLANRGVITPDEHRAWGQRPGPGDAFVSAVIETESRRSTPPILAPPAVGREHELLRPISPPCGAAQFDMLSVPRGRELTRADFEQPTIIRHTARELARSHLHSERMEASSQLHLTLDALNRIHNVATHPKKIEVSCIDPARARNLALHLGSHLERDAQTRLLIDFNFYPATMHFAESDASLQSNPDQTGHGYHAFFEPLARLAYTARLNHWGSNILLEAYMQERFGRQPSEAEGQTMLEAGLLLNLCYYFYFIDIAWDTPRIGTESEIERERALASGQTLLSRIRGDQAALATSLPQSLWLVVPEK